MYGYCVINLTLSKDMQRKTVWFEHTTHAVYTVNTPNRKQAPKILEKSVKM